MPWWQLAPAHAGPAVGAGCLTEAAAPRRVRRARHGVAVAERLNDGLRPQLRRQRLTVPISAPGRRRTDRTKLATD